MLIPEDGKQVPPPKKKNMEQGTLVSISAKIFACYLLRNLTHFLVIQHSTVHFVNRTPMNRSSLLVIENFLECTVCNSS